MNNKGIAYTFSAKVWYSEWYFVSLPADMSKEIRRKFQLLEEGWGRLKVTAKIGNTQWKTSIWYDTKSQTYLFPIKKEVRNKEKIGIDTTVTIALWI